MPHVDFTKVFTTAAVTGKRETLSITLDGGKVFEGGTASLPSAHEESVGKKTFDTTASRASSPNHAYQGSLTSRKYTREQLRSLIVECP